MGQTQLKHLCAVTAVLLPQAELVPPSQVFCGSGKNNAPYTLPAGSLAAGDAWAQEAHNAHVCSGPITLPRDPQGPAPWQTQ